MPSRMFLGTVAGALGTVALDVTTYGDMAARGRAPSQMARTVVQKLAGRLGLRGLADSQPGDVLRNKQDAIGALLGYATGVGVGVAYAAVRPLVRAHMPATIGGLAAGATAMALIDGLAVNLGATDISEWDSSSWLSDAIPHAVYGLAVALTFEALDEA